jgi:non-ribosomal peptide synthetase component E (peptide arylation enzyme)
MDKTIRRVTNFEEQQAETYRYWQSRPIGERLKAVCEASEQAYAFAGGFKRKSDEPDQRSEGHPQGV